MTGFKALNFLINWLIFILQIYLIYNSFLAIRWLFIKNIFWGILITLVLIIFWSTILWPLISNIKKELKHANRVLFFKISNGKVFARELETWMLKILLYEKPTLIPKSLIFLYASDKASDFDPIIANIYAHLEKEQSKHINIWVIISILVKVQPQYDDSYYFCYLETLDGKYFIVSFQAFGELRLHGLNRIPLPIDLIPEDMNKEKHLIMSLFLANRETALYYFLDTNLRIKSYRKQLLNEQ